MPEPCGCEVIQIPSYEIAEYKIIYCSMHKAAEDMYKLVERMADFDCFKPWGVNCEHCDGGETPCEACQAKELLPRATEKATK